MHHAFLHVIVHLAFLVPELEEIFIRLQSILWLYHTVIFNEVQCLGLAFEYYNHPSAGHLFINFLQMYDPQATGKLSFVILLVGACLERIYLFLLFLSNFSGI